MLARAVGLFFRAALPRPSRRAIERCAAVPARRVGRLRLFVPDIVAPPLPAPRPERLAIRFRALQAHRALGARFAIGAATFFRARR